MRIGDLDALTDVIEGTDWYHPTEIGTMAHGAASGDNAWYRAGDIFKAIEEAPTIDAVPVVRCYQCKYYAKSMVLCHHEDGLAAPDKMDFCSYGERKDGDTDG